MKLKSFKTFITSKYDEYFEINYPNTFKNLSNLYEIALKDERAAELVVAYYFSHNKNQQAIKFAKIIKKTYKSLADVLDDNYFKYTREYQTYKNLTLNSKLTVSKDILKIIESKNISIKKAAEIMKIDRANLYNFLKKDKLSVFSFDTILEAFLLLKEYNKQLNQEYIKKYNL